MQSLISPRFLALLFCVGTITATAQLPSSSFNYSCRRTIVAGCGGGCVNFTAQIPNIRTSGNYTVSNLLDCFRPGIAASPFGTPVSFSADDKYSGLLSLPFDFPFYGSTYNSVTASTNGVLSFDPLTANAFADWNFLSNTLPSIAYGRALIMWPYHDLDFTANPPSDMSMALTVSGQAPHRKWIVTYYHVPLYTCDNLNQNTQQVVLHESTGIVEVFVFTRQQCAGWNTGKAMIGMQNYDRTKGITAPGRTGNDTWGGADINEAWRFVPSEGTSLLKRVELYKLDGTLVATGDTLDTVNGNYEVMFNNVCFSDTGRFIIKSTYNHFQYPAVTDEVYATDTVYIVASAGPQFTASVIPYDCTNNSGGTITVTATGTAPFMYSINAVVFGNSNVFTGLTPGMYTVSVKDANGCTSVQTIAVMGVNPLPVTVSYPKTIYCNAQASIEQPIINGSASGRFTVAPQGLLLNETTGEITIPESDTGLYTITYHTADGICTSPEAFTKVRITGTDKVVWTGAVDDSWENPANWACGAVPAASSDVVVYGGTITISSNVTVNTLTVVPGASVTVQSGYNLVVVH